MREFIADSRFSAAFSVTHASPGVGVHSISRQFKDLRPSYGTKEQATAIVIAR